MERVSAFSRIAFAIAAAGERGKTAASSLHSSHSPL
ncbi:hypothetical protein B23_0848 [Geobacillus thermoleovorans B23]|nr:hypothetical protein B23_0848 [Geobacillus thermoleovorans B23]